MATKQRDGTGAAGKEKKVTSPSPSTSLHKDDRRQKSSSRPSSSSGVPTNDLAASSSSPSSQPRTKASPSYLKPTFNSLLHEPVKQGVKKLHGSEESTAEKLMRRRSFDSKTPSSSRGQKPLLSSSASFSPKSSNLTRSPSADKISSKLIKPVKSQTPSLSTKNTKKPTSTSTNLIPKRDSKVSPTTNHAAKKAPPVSEEIANPPNTEAVLADKKLPTVVAKDDPPKTKIPAIEPVPVITNDLPKTAIPAVEQVPEISTEQEEVKADDVMITSPEQNEEEGNEKMGTQDIPVVSEPVVSEDLKKEPTLAPIITKAGEEDHQKDEETIDTIENPKKDESEQRTSDISQDVEMETKASMEDGETDLNATSDNKGKEEENTKQYNSNEEVTKAEKVTPKEENPFKADAMSSIQKRQTGSTSNQDKKITSPVSNNVIEETTSKLMEKRNRVRAMAGAFETVISLQQPDNH